MHNFLGKVMQVADDTDNENCTEFQGRLGPSYGSLLAKKLHNWEEVILNISV